MKRKQQGFSLFELIAVIGIVALLAGGALFSFSKLQKSSAIETTLTNMRKLLTQGRESVRKGECKDMKFTFNQTQLTAQCLDENPQVVYSPVVIPSNLSITFTETAPIEFTIHNKGLGGLSLDPTNLSFAFTLTKDPESIPPYPLDQTKILYGPF